MGRFFQTDPSRQEMNPYQYGLSNPVMHTDPLGLLSLSTFTVTNVLIEMLGNSVSTTALLEQLLQSCDAAFSPVNVINKDFSGGGVDSFANVALEESAMAEARGMTIDALKFALNEFGITVDLSLVDTQYQRPALEVILQAVLIGGERISEAANGFRSASSAFVRVFGTTAIKIYAGDCVSLTHGCWFGDNNGYGAVELALTELLHGGIMKRNGHPVSGIQLTMHEIAHNLTKVYYGYPSTFRSAQGNRIDYPEGLGVQAGNHGSNPPAAGEMTADAIASWALNDFEGSYANDVRDYVNNYMNGVLNCVLNSCP